MDWNNVNMNYAHERDSKILDAYSFDCLFEEIYSNLSEVNEATVSKLFKEMLESKINCAKEIFEANLDNIVKYAIEERKEPDHDLQEGLKAFHALEINKDAQEVTELVYDHFLESMPPLKMFSYGFYFMEKIDHNDKGAIYWKFTTLENKYFVQLSNV